MASIMSNRPTQAANDLMNIVNQARNGNPMAMAQQMLNANPALQQQFNNLMQMNQGMSPRQIAISMLQQRGIDPRTLGF
jgi:hypothetical protein